MNKGRPGGFGKQMPPQPEHIIIYFVQKGLTERDAMVFYESHRAGQWKTVRGRAIRNWKAVAADYAWEALRQRKR